jgi:hypothetical protein
MAATVSMNGQIVSNVATPVALTDAANKGYVDSARAGLDPKASVRLGSATGIPVTYNPTGGISGRGQITTAPNILDGGTLQLGNRVGLVGQTNGAQNGVWVVTAVGTGSNGVWDRADDFDSDTKVTAGAYFWISEGTLNADSGWYLLTDDPITLGGPGGTSLVFTQYSGAGSINAGAGMVKTGPKIDIVSANSGRIVVNADSIDLASDIIAASGTYRSVTVDTYGRVTAGTNPTTLAGYGISNAQPLNSTLSALAALTTTANTFIYATGADAFAQSSITAFGRTWLALVDQAAGRTALSLGTMAQQDASAVAITGGTIDNIVIDGGTF